MLLSYVSFRMAIGVLKICVSNLLAIFQPTMLGAVVARFQMKIWLVLSRFKCMSWTAVNVHSQSNVWLALSSYQSACISVSKQASWRTVKVRHACLKYQLIYWTKGRELLYLVCWRYFFELCDKSEDTFCKILYARYFSLMTGEGASASRLAGCSLNEAASRV